MCIINIIKCRFKIQIKKSQPNEIIEQPTAFKNIAGSVKNAIYTRTYYFKRFHRKVMVYSAFKISIRTNRGVRERKRRKSRRERRAHGEPRALAQSAAGPPRPGPPARPAAPPRRTREKRRRLAAVASECLGLSPVKRRSGAAAGRLAARPRAALAARPQLASACTCRHVFSTVYTRHASSDARQVCHTRDLRATSVRHRFSFHCSSFYFTVATI